MNTNLLEKVLWDFGNDPSRIGPFLEKPDDYLKQYPLSEEEARAIKDLDVRTLSENKVNVLLTMMTYIMMKGPQAMPEYLQRMNTPRA